MYVTFSKETPYLERSVL